LVCFITASITERLTHVPHVLTGGLEFKFRTGKIFHSCVNGSKLLSFSMLQVLLDHDAARLRCCHSNSNASQYSQRFGKWRHLWPKGKKK